MAQDELIEKIKHAIESDPQKEYIKSVSLFGSFLHGDNDEDSDLDLLFEAKKQMGYFTLFAIQDRLAQKLGRPVDLVSKHELSRYFRDQVLDEAKQIYYNDHT